MPFSKIAAAQALLRAAHRSQIQKTAGIAGTLLGGIGKGALGLAKGVGKLGLGAGKLGWKATGAAVPESVGLLRTPLRALTGAMALGGLYAAGKAGVQKARTSMIGFDPNVQGYSRQRVNPEQSYQEVFI